MYGAKHDGDDVLAYVEHELTREHDDDFFDADLNSPVVHS